MTVLSQRSFAGGEFSPAVGARADLAKFQTGLSRVRNWFVMKHGGISNRAGTGMICEVSNSLRRIREIDWVFSVDQSYVLEFGHLYMRVIRNGTLVSTAHATLITSISSASQAVVTHTAHGYSNLDEVRFYGLTGGMSKMNGRIFTVEVINANSYYIQLRGVRFDTGGLSAFTGSVTAYKIFKLTTIYEEADLCTLHYVQSGDVMTIVHPNYPIQDLARLTETSWTLTASSFAATLSGPTSASAAAGGAGAITHSYYVTSIRGVTFEESLPSTGTASPKNIVNVTVGVNLALTSTYIRFYVTAHGYSVGNTVIVSGIAITSAYEYNGRSYKIIAVATDYFDVLDPTYGQSFNYHTYVTSPASGTVTKVTLTVAAAAPTVAAPIVITWALVDGAVSYNIYKAINGVYGYLGSAEGTTFNDIGLDPDITDTPPQSKNLFLGEGNYPSTVNYFQQRKLFASSINNPESTWGSRTGQFNNFYSSNPLQSDDSLNFDLAGKRVNRIKHILDLGRLVYLTSEGELAVGSDDGILDASQPVNIKTSSYNGCGDLAPILINNSAVYLQARGSIVRDLKFNIDSNGFDGEDLTIFSSHLFEGHTIVAWAYQKNPHSIIWAVRDDGILLGCTYIREQQLLAWHRHDLDGGFVEDACVIPEGANDSLYITVLRTVDGETRRYIERMSARSFSDVTEDCTILDSFLTYDGSNGNLGYAPAGTLSLSGGSTWLAGELLELNSSVSLFSVFSSDIGNEFHLKLNGDVLRCEVIDDPSNTAFHVKVRAHKNVPAAFQIVDIDDWRRAVDRVEGLWHLEGKSVSVFADGFVDANPNNRSYNVITVLDGAIDLPECRGIIHVGLPITSDFETLDVEFTNAESMINKKININQVNFKVLDSRGGLWVGGSKPTDTEELSSATFLKGLREEKVRQYEGYDSPIALNTGKVSVLIPGDWKSNGRIFGRVTDPVPCTVLSVHPEGNIPIKGAG